MSAWDSKFAELQITHLRSPMFFHPDPRDRDGLLGWVYKNGRERELREIKGVIGKGLSKYQRKQATKQRPSALPQETSYLDERFRPDYYRPCKARPDNIVRTGESGLISRAVKKTTES